MNDDNVKFTLGRAVSDDTIHVRTKVFDELKELHQAFKPTPSQLHPRITAPDIADSLTLECDEVRRALKYFEKRNVVKHLSEHRQTSLDGGRPATVWEIISLTVS